METLLDPSKFNWKWYIPSTSDWLLSSNENTANLTCIKATSEPVNLELNISDLQGLLIFHAWKTINDPYNEANITLSTTPIGCIAETDGNGWYQYSYNMALQDSSTNAAQIILEGLTNCGTIAVRNGTWNANLGTLPANVVLTIDNGASGITYTPSGGDYVIDRASGNFWWNGVNDTYLLANPSTSAIANATINAIIASSTYDWAQITNANTTVNSLITSAFASLTTSSNFDTSVNQLIGLASISTSQISGFSTAVNNLISASTINWSQINFANLTVSQLILNYMNTETLPYSNITGTPSGVQPYTYFIGALTNGTYYAVNGTNNQYITSWTSTDASTTIQNAFNAIIASGNSGTVQFGSGKFYCDNLNIAGGIQIRGQGYIATGTTNATDLIQNGPGNILNYVGSSTEFAFAISNMEIAGSRSDYTTGSGTLHCTCRERAI